MSISRNTWDNVVVVTRDESGEQTWDGKVKNLVYDSATMAWIAQEPGSGGGGSGGDASASNQVTGNNYLASIDAKTPDAELSTRVDDNGAGVTYVGHADPGTSNSSSAWRIKKITDSNGSLTVTYADGNTNFDNIWNSRSSLSYS